MFKPPLSLWIHVRSALTLSDIGWDLCEFRPKAPVYSVTNIIFSVINIKLDEQEKWSNQIERKQCWTNNHWMWSQAKWFKWLPILFCLCTLNGKPDMTRPRKDKYDVLLSNRQNLDNYLLWSNLFFISTSLNPTHPQPHPTLPKSAKNMNKGVVLPDPPTHKMNNVHFFFFFLHLSLK